VTPKEKAEATWQKVSRLETLLQQKEDELWGTKEELETAKQAVHQYASTIARLEGELKIVHAELASLHKLFTLSDEDNTRLREENERLQIGLAQTVIEIDEDGIVYAPPDYQSEVTRLERELKTAIQLAEKRSSDFLRLQGAVKDKDFIEKRSKAVHQAYCKGYIAKHGKPYWTGGDYSRLDNETKEIDRCTVRAVLSLLASLTHPAEKTKKEKP